MMIMKNVRIEADCPGTVIVGDVVFNIRRMDSEKISLGIQAPKELKIKASWREESKGVEQE